jgi:uncharacterized protein YoxC
LGIDYALLVDVSWILVAAFLLIVFGGISLVGTLHRIRDAVEETAMNTRAMERMQREQLEQASRARD